MTIRGHRPWLVAVGLIVLSAVPIGAGAVRIAELAGGATVTVTAENARFFAAPVPVVVHIVGASLFCVLGAFQFVPRLSRGKRPWHRWAGRMVVPSGLAAAFSGLWMTLFYELPASDDQTVELFGVAFGVLQAFRLLFGSGMVLALVAGVAAIRTRDVARHRQWMLRAYAIGLGAGTQVLTTVPWLLIVGRPEGTVRALLMLAGWVLNLAIVEFHRFADRAPPSVDEPGERRARRDKHWLPTGLSAAPGARHGAKGTRLQ